MNRIKFILFILLMVIAASCTSTPFVTTSGQTAATNGNLGPTETQPPAATETITETATITPTPTKVPDVELAQLQTDGALFFSEIINHLDVPVVFEDQKPAFRFDIYDPVLDRHFQGEEMVERYYSDPASVPCVLYPGETAFFFGGHSIIYKWLRLENASPFEVIKITYQSLGVPRPDWNMKGTHYEIRDLKWRIDGNILYFSFRHDPLHRVYGGKEYFVGMMGLYDKDNHLLGVAGGRPLASIDTGIADDFWVSFDIHSRGYNDNGWGLIGVDNIKERFVHIKLMLEVLPDYDGFCRKMTPTPTP
jgi:hypothetical protein